jgi:hypothetical protein
MKRAACWLAIVLFTALGPTAPHAQQPINDGDRVILITLDGARHQEIFGGLNVDILKSTLREGQKVEEHSAYKRFWAETPEARRQKLLPFFWGTLMAKHGSIAGNRAAGSSVSLTNKHWFSYPGYSEILLGEAHDDTIKSNDPIRNPYPSVLEGLKTKLGLPRERVATFASWGVFNAIVEHEAGAIYVDAGPGLDLPNQTGSQDPALKELRAMQQEVLPPWDGIRSDFFTFKFAMAHLAAKRPRVVYIAFDETDDYAHDGKYERVLDTYAKTDRYLEQLWTWTQSQPDYRDRTHFLITTDHGRGKTGEDWKGHGAKVVGADETWMAFVSPRMSQRGEWRNQPALTTSQIAATIANWLGLDWKAAHPAAGAAIR